jgi:osmotically-inducible protein OsmY
MLITLTACVEPSTRHRSTGRYIDDKAIAARVEDALEDDPLYKYDHIRAAVYRGTVQLNGFALNEAQKQRAGEIASHVAGVLSLENNISIAPEPARVRDANDTSAAEKERREASRQP